MRNTLFKHQRNAFDSLLVTSRVFFNEDWQQLPIKPRFSRFVVGPSGAGKTHIVRMVAEHLGLPLYTVDATNWMPLGASDRAARSTWADIVEFVGSNPQGIIFVDELDKLGHAQGHGSAWMQYLRVEIFALLDRRVPSHIALPEGTDADERPAMLELTNKRLQQGMMLIGAGAFQSLWEERGKPTIGLVPEKEESRTDFTHRDMQQAIPTELANRFAGPVLVLAPLREDDYRQLLRRTASQLPKDLASRLARNGRKEIRSAVENDLGVRWVEELLLKSLVQKRAKKTEVPHLFNAAA